MSGSMFRQQVTLTVSYDPDEYDHPMHWDWTELSGSYCRVISYGDIEPVFIESDDDNE